MKSFPFYIGAAAGSTPLERISVGMGSAADLELVQQQNQQHQEWLKTKPGRRWLRDRARERRQEGGSP